MLSKTLVISTVATTALAVAGPAFADPPQETLPLTCGGMTLLLAVAPANGTFTPNFDTASTAVFKPTMITVSKQIYEGSEPAGAADIETSVLGQGKQAQRSDSVVCEGSETLPGEGVGLPEGQSLVVSMTAIGFSPPRKA